MGIPNPVHIAKRVAEGIYGPPLTVAKAGVHVTKAAVRTLDKAPRAVADFVTMPMQMLQTSFNIGIWVLGHLKMIFLALLAVVVLFLLSMLRTAFQATQTRVSDTVRGKQPVRSKVKVGSGRAASHPQGVVQPDGMLCVRGGLREADHICRRQHAGKPVSRGRCHDHNGSHLFEAV